MPPTFVNNMGEIMFLDKIRVLGTNLRGNAEVHFKWVIYEDKSLTEEPGSILKDNMESFVPFRAIIGIHRLGYVSEFTRTRSIGQF